ncbi:MAG: hypothetical protein B7Y45_00620 [Sphingomonas sp. 28-66-16]|nr:MAG: hypothetical protein B7Y45_00620 [Sphingomonas sp. 28-66-16]
MRTHKMVMLLLAGLTLGSGSAWAQSAIDGRVDRLEREMRAVQRKVFPGGNSQYFPPDITAPQGPANPLPGTPASSPVTDLNARVNALESQFSSMTGQIEQAQHKLQLIEDAFNAYKRTTEARLKVLEDAASSTATAAPLTVPNATAPTAGTGTGPAAKPKPKPGSAVPADPAKPGAVAPARAQLVAAVEKPRTDDPADDDYVYGYRLWAAKLYPEAEAQLKSVVAKYPNHRRASWAQNLLGRTYLDDGKPSLASLAFYDNYKKFHDGERAPESLYYLAVALKKLGKPSADICKVYDELTEVYGDRITASMKADVARGRSEEKCKGA